MNKKDVAELFRFIKCFFPQFEVDQYKIDKWASMLHDQNPTRIMQNAERYVLENKFTPTIADLRERHHIAYSSNTLNQIKEWERNASRK